MNNQKRVVVILFVIILFMIKPLDASSSLGLSPAVIYTDFQSEGKLMVNFNVLAASPDQKLTVFAEGDFAEFVKFDMVNFTGPRAFTAYIDLPKEWYKPGKNKLVIKVAQIKEKDVGIGTRIQVGALIEIKVPYPGKYLEITDFSIPNVNQGEPVNMNMDVDSLGHEPVYTTPEITVYLGKEVFESFNLESQVIDNQTTFRFSKTFEKNYPAGNYLARAVIRYGDFNNPTIINATREFRVGTLFVDINNWTTIANASKINEFFVDVESRWNLILPNVYADVVVYDRNNLKVDNFKTPSTALNPWQKARLTGFLNAEKLTPGPYKAKITVYYEDKTTEKDTDLLLLKINQSFLSSLKEMDSMFIVVILIAVMIVIILMTLIVLVVYLLRKDKERENYFISLVQNSIANNNNSRTSRKTLQ